MTGTSLSQVTIPKGVTLTAKPGAKSDNVEYTSVWWNEGVHGKNIYTYSNAWQEYLKELNPNTVTMVEIIKIGRKVAKKYGFEVRF